MAVFNPQVPQTNDPNYLGYSRPITQPEANKSAGIMLETAGNVLDEGAKLGDFIVKKGIDDQLHSAIDTERQGYTDALKAADEAVKGGGNIVNPQGTPKGGEAPPSGLDAITSQISTITSARGNGRISLTDYNGRLDMIAKDFRSRYPGWRDYIDKKIESITGENPANAQIKSLLGDVNSFITNQQAEKNKVRNQIIDNPFPGAAGIVRGMDIPTGQPGHITQYQGIQWLEQRKGQEALWKFYEAGLNFKKSDRGERTTYVEQKSFEIANTLASNNFDNMATAGGLNIAKTMYGFMKGDIKVKDEEWRDIGMVVDANNLETANGIRKKLFELKDPNTGETWGELLGDKITKVINDAMSMHNNASTAIHSKDKGLAFAHLNAGSAIMADTNYKYLENKDMRSMGALLHYFHTVGGPNAIQEAFLRTITGNIIPELHKKFQEDFMRAVGQIDPDIRKHNGAFNLRNLVDENAYKNLPDDPEYNKSIANLPTALLSKNIDDPGKNGLVKFAFSPGNVGVLSKFGGIDDQIKIFNDWTQPKMTGELKRLGPQQLQDYKDWSEKSSAKLFREKILNLNTYQDFQNVKLNWNPQALRLDAEVQMGQGRGLPQDTRHPEVVRQGIQGKLNELNILFTNMGEIARASGMDPNEYIIKSLIQQGANLDNVKDPSGVILKGMLEKSLGTGEKKMKYSDDGDATTGSLRAFLKNPGGPLGTQRFNAPAGSAGASGGNLGDILGIQVDDIPKGMSAQQFLRILQKKAGPSTTGSQ